MEGEISPSDIKTHPKLIKAAQEEIGKLDILVCGQCHDVFHFVEEFQQHKEPNNCSGSSTIRENSNQENKPQVWAFLLWKNAQYKDGEIENENSWTIYQRWCKVAASAKEAWIVAARSVQTFSKISTAKMQEVRTHKTMIAKHRIAPNAGGALNSGVNLANVEIKKEEPLEEGEIRLSDLTEEQRKFAKIESHSMDEEDDPEGSDLDSESELDTEEELEKQEELAAIKKNRLKQQINENVEKKLLTKAVLKPITSLAASKPMQVNSAVTSNTPTPVTKYQPIVVTSRKAIRSFKDDSKDGETKEMNIDRILAKRYNPRKKTFEYLLKWEGCNHDANTWEPVAHLEGCKQLLEIFEKNLARQKEIKAAQQSLQTATHKIVTKTITSAKPTVSTPSASTSATLTPSGRPQRTSKQKALNQVKAWCGDIVDNDENGFKRRSDSDSDDDMMDTKKMRLQDTDSDEGTAQHKQTVTVHRIIKQAPGNRASGGVINGVNKKQDGSTTASPVILTNKGGTAIKMDQKQVQGLSKGVYIMNQETGIVKLDNRGVAGQARIMKGNTIVRVTPKVTQMRVVQKEDEGTGSSSMRLSPGMSTSTVQKQIIRRPGPGRPPLKSPTKVVQPAKQVVGRSSLGTPTARILGKNPKVMQKTQVVSQAITKVPLITPTPPDDDSDDGLGNEEDLFPKDLPLPAPDSPPRDFTLCPLTGKVLGPGQAAATGQSEAGTAVATDTLEALVKTVTEGNDSQSQDAESASVDSSSLPMLSGTSSETAQGVTEVTENDPTDDVSAVTLDGETPLMITGEDGVVYRVAGQNEQGQTLLVAQGADGQQQCMLVTTDQEDGSEGVLTLDTAVAEAVAQIGEGSSVEQPLTINTGVEGAVEMETNEADDGQVVAEIVKAEPPSPGGTRKVVLLMPDGSLVMTSVDAEHYASLDLDDK